MGDVFLIAGTISVLAALSAGPVTPEILHLAKIQNNAKSGLSGIPAYTCSETMERSTRDTARGPFHRNDELKLEVAEIGGKELFSKAGEKAFSEDGLQQYAARGLIATGMFYHMADTVFGTPVARFEYAGIKRLKGHRALQYNLTVSELFANYRLEFNYHAAQCGMKGSIWADETSYDLLRMHLEATDIPPELLLRSAVTEIDYSRAAMDGKSYLIPSSAEIVTEFLNGTGSRNHIRFSNCHKYGVESTLIFQ